MDYGKSHFMRTKTLQFLIIFICLLIVGFTKLQPTQAQAQVNTGYQDFYYGSARAPTAEKPQSKVWFHDGLWWGVLYNHDSNFYEIYKLDWATQDWSSTEVRVDSRLHSTHDALSVNGLLFIASAAIPPSVDPAIPVPEFPEIKVFSYNYIPANKTYAATEIATVYTNWVETVVIDHDSLNRLWITFTDFNPDNLTKNVFFTHTQDTYFDWSEPSVLNFPEAKNLNADDISTLVASNGSIGVMWSNQTPDFQNKTHVYFAVHNDDVSDQIWTLDTVLSGQKFADDHLNIKSLQADSSGQVFAVVKTSLNDGNSPDPGAPLIYLLIRSQNGNWSPRVVAQVKDLWTRPILLIDEENREIYIFATKMIPPQMTGSIYYKHINLDEPGMQFEGGIGIPFLEFFEPNNEFTHINNASSTKQPLNGTTNLVVIAGDDTQQFYVHNLIDLPDPPQPPVYEVFLSLIIN